MFVDEVVVKLIAGKGGDGCTSFRREKFIPMGGPNGGNGGKGASIIFKTDKSLKTLIDLKMLKTIKGDKGVNGKGSDQNGANAENVIIKVPEGTVVTNLKTGKVLCDLINDEEFVVARGGRGGRGNRAFATHDNPAPKMSELGEPGEEIEVKCELKVLADVGLVGLPSVGKSSLLKVISNANPKIGAYHFTTLSPNLGVVRVYDDSFVMADLPGIIEGASEGVGLGFNFLRHAERCKILAYVVDMGGIEFNPIDGYEMVYKEVKKYSEDLANRPCVIVANKMDLENAKTNLELFKIKYPNLKIFPISALFNEGIKDLLIELNKMVKESETNIKQDINESHILYKYDNSKPFKIYKDNSVWVVEGSEIEKLFKMTRFNEDESVLRFARKLKGMGVEEELEKLGAKRGDEVRILDYIFNFKE